MSRTQVRNTVNDRDSAGDLHWADDTFAVLDTETTGLDVRSAHIVAIAVLLVDSSGRVLPESYESILRLDLAIPQEAVAVHGITTERMRREGAAPDAVYGRVADMLWRVHRQHRALVIYNAPFDWPLLLLNAARYGQLLPRGVPLLDPLCLDRALDRYRRGSRTLAEVARHYGIETQGAHSAGGDAATAARLARSIVRTYPTLREFSLSALHERQVAWYQAWQDGVNQYLVRNGRPPRERTGWPQ